MSNMMERLKSASANNVKAATMSEYSEDDKYVVQLNQLMLNLLFSGKLQGPGAGITPGLHMLAGPSKMGKSQIGINVVKAFLDADPENMCVFHDIEFGGGDTWAKLGIDLDRVIHVPIMDVEAWKFDFMQKFEAMKDMPKGKVIFFTDSLGLMGSKKETDDAVDQKSVADMSRAKSIKSALRLLIPRLNFYKCPMICINHTGMTIGGMFQQEVQTGGQAATLAPNTVVFFGKSKLVGDTGDATNYNLAGFEFKLKINKSRILKEGSVLPLQFFYGEREPNNYSGIISLAYELGILYSPSRGWRGFDAIDLETGEVKETVKLRGSEFEWPSCERYEEVCERLLTETQLIERIQKRFKMLFD